MIQRYRIFQDTCAEMVEEQSPTGDWCKWEDVVGILSRCRSLIVLLDEICEQGGYAISPDEENNPLYGQPSRESKAMHDAINLIRELPK